VAGGVGVVERGGGVAAAWQAAPVRFFRHHARGGGGGAEKCTQTSSFLPWPRQLLFFGTKVCVVWRLLHGR